MKTEIKTIISNLESTLSGDPWFGKPVYEILDEVNSKKAFIKANNNSHSLIDLLYHMLTWANFTLKRIEKEKIKDLAAFEELDWRKINPKIHTWKKGLAEFKAVNKKLISILKKQDDTFLNEKVDYREYDFRYLLNGMIQHHIYHIGQIAYLTKLLD